MTGDMATCGTCGFTWDDSIVTGRTPVPSARTPCEYWHVYDDGDEYAGLDASAIADDADFIDTVRGSWPDVDSEICLACGAYEDTHGEPGKRCP